MNYGNGLASNFAGAALPVTGFALNFPLWIILASATLFFMAKAILSLVSKPDKVKP